jgi:hypothetical protein
MRSAIIVAPRVFWWIMSVVSSKPRRRAMLSYERLSTKSCVAARADRA